MSGSAPRCAFILFAISSAPVFAQFTTPVIDGTIGSGEYGNTANGTNQISTSTGQTWYMTWDASNLYVAITNANTSEAAVLYIDANPIAPPNGGTNANGSLTGFNYDGEEVSTLPFRAQFVTYFKDGYREFRTSDGNGGWTSGTSGFGQFADNGGTGVRELAIPWTAINSAGIPSSFLFFGLLTSSGGYVYGQVPGDNGGGPIGTSATYTQYFQVNSTANGASTPPFSNENSSSGVLFSGLFHNTFDPYYRSQEGAVPAGTTVNLSFRTARLNATAANLRTYLFDPVSGNTAGPTDMPMTYAGTRTENGVLYDEWSIAYATPTTATIVYYKFQAFNGSTSAWYSDDYIDGYDNLNKDGTGVASATEPFNSFQITAYAPGFQTPTWMANANLYFIMPDRFRNGDPTNDYCVQGSSAGCPSFYGAPPSTNYINMPWNSQMCDPRNSTSACYNNFGSNFYNGDLAGVQAELSYIQSLGFDSIYLNPIFAASSYHRYDTDDYMNVDPALGGNAAFTSLITAMNQRGMQVILDGVFNHASSDSTYFDEYLRFNDNGACESLSSQWRDWFNFLDSNVPCTTADYVGWDGVNTLPEINHTVQDVQNFFYAGSPNVMQNWYNQGAGGWRFDVAPDPNFPFSWWVNTRTYAKGYNPNGPLIGEIWPNASQWLAGNGLDGTMNYRFRRNVSGFVIWPNTWVDDNDNGSDAIIPLTPSQFDIANRAVRDDYPPQSTAVNMNLLDSHDTNRALFVYTQPGDNGLVQAKQRLQLAALMQFTYIGTPTVFYGDEIALNSPSLNNGPNGPIGDPYTRAPYPWTDQPGNPNIYGPPDSNVMSFYTLLGHMRKQHSSLRDGTFTTLLTGDTQQPATAASTYAFARSDSNETAIVAMNNGPATNNPTIPVGAFYSDGTQLQDAFSGAIFTVSGGNISPTLNALSGMVLLPAPNTVDVIPPTGTVVLTPALNGAGWTNQSSVNAQVNGADSGSGVSQVRAWVDGGAVTSAAGSSASVAVSGEGEHVVGAFVIDNAGNVSSQISQAVNIDVTPPVVTVTGVVAGTVYAAGSANAGCTAADALSGVAKQPKLKIVTNSNPRVFTAACYGATDVAGNAAPTVTVTYEVVQPALRAYNGAHSAGPNGERTVELLLDNVGNGLTNDCTITSITGITVTNGSGTVSVASGLPGNIGTLSPGTSGQAAINFNWPTTAKGVRMTVNFTAEGTYSGSTTLTMAR